MNIILTAISYFFILLIGILPFWVLYVFSDIIRFFLQYVFGYRKAVIKGNLKRCFPELTEKELNQLVSKSYKNLTDVMVESFKAFTMSKKQLVERHKIINPELVSKYKNSGKSFIALPCHYGNWEWGAMSPALQFDYQIVAIYTALSNPYLDKLVRKNRSRTGTLLASTKDTSKTFDALATTESMFILAADQSPSKPIRAIWVEFLGQQTAFLNGPEKHAVLRDMPVVFVDIQRVKRGFYTLELSYITETPTTTEPTEITRAYAKCLEKAILKKPENWLWSHKRWKLNKD